MPEEKKPTKKKSTKRTEPYTLVELNELAKEGRRALRKKEGKK